MGFPLVAAGLGGALFGGLFGGKKKRRGPSEQELQRQHELRMQQAQWEREDALRRQAQEAAEQERRRQELKEQMELAKWQELLPKARQQNYELANQVISSYGLDPSEFSPRVESELDRTLGGLSVGTNPFSVVDGRSIASNILDDELRNRRSTYTAQVNQRFGPNYGDRLIDDNMLDSIVDDILNTQQQGAVDFLDRGAKRGIFNEKGISAGQKLINDTANAGRSQLAALADGIIRGYEGQADRVRDQAFGAAQGYTFGSQFNLDDFLQQGNKIAERAQQNAPGELRTAFGGQQLFDLSSIQNRAGQAQGATNLKDNSIIAALERRNKQAAQKRGIGSQGVF